MIMTSRASHLLRQRLAAFFPDACHITNVMPDKRVIPASRNRHVRGWHPVRPGHLPVPFESKLECRALSALVEFDEVCRVRSQPITVVYEYDGRSYRYTPDFLVELSAVPKALAGLGFGLQTYVEVKPLRHALRTEHALLRKFDVVRNATQTTVTLLTDWDLSLAEQEVRHGA